MRDDAVLCRALPLGRGLGREFRSWLKSRSVQRPIIRSYHYVVLPLSYTTNSTGESTL